MANINNFQLNTHFTALKQLPDRYTATVSFGGTYGYALGQTLASADIQVPPGAYVENALMRSSIDGGINYLTHEYAWNLTNYSFLSFSLYQTGSSTYQLKVALTNTESGTVTVPQSTLTAILRLAQAPFTV